MKLLNKVIDATVVKQVMLTSSQNMTIKIIYDNTNDDDDDMIVMLIMMNIQPHSHNINNHNHLRAHEAFVVECSHGKY